MPLAEARSQRLEEGLLGGEAGRVVLGPEELALAVGDLAGGERSARRIPVLFDQPAHPVDLDHVHADSLDHGNLLLSIGKARRKSNFPARGGRGGGSFGAGIWYTGGIP